MGKPIPPFDLGAYLTGFRERMTDGMLTIREAQIVDRLTDEELERTDIASVLFCVWLQHSQSEVAEIPDTWWTAVVAGAKLPVKSRMRA